MKYSHFLTKITVADAVLDTVEDKEENVEVSCNKVKGVPVLYFKDKNTGEIIDCIVLR